MEKHYQKGQISTEEMAQTRIEVLKADLDLCESDKARVGLHQRIVSQYKEIEKLKEAGFKAGQVTQADLLRAKVNRLEAEIELERARAKTATQPK